MRTWMKRYFSFILLIIGLSSCKRIEVANEFESRTFLVSKQALLSAVVSLYLEYPKYIVPKDLGNFDNWRDNNDYLHDGRLFYFESNPQEIYLVTFTKGEKDSLSIPNTDIKIKAFETKKWLGHLGKNRVEFRKGLTKEIISKLENYTKTTVRKNKLKTNVYKVY